MVLLLSLRSDGLELKAKPISGATNENVVRGASEVLAYGTAVKFKK
ncbi:hypothetical protein HN592_01390 [Candidatus Woesearchaeota archaeon]|nr:hypothetical protein [Candidatus Woesearchaeota archaeon]MBT4368664.1 hypothetical protein [Candidatus Woesearchaeota archaeon]MBT4712219.1 hypothetical protein [Candidatus Woesearchaeota archaeon]MBT6638949.1 hypothetical protein [Candidatus Woesearchaeota archaeon]MBT7134149.1 hypothetical protein [Candidatus Woesearchaeota archaeon]